MVKQTVGECGNQWRSQEANDGIVFNTVSCIAASFWPCGSYSRTSHLLRNAASGSSSGESFEQSCCGCDCIKFALGLPFYSCFVSTLQGRVRSLYGIEGNGASDWCDSCFCPCLTMARNEQEIVLRERHKAKGHHHHEKPMTISASGYHSTNAMSYLSPDSARSARGKSPGKEAAVDKSRVQDPHELCNDELASSNTVAYPQVHYLDQHWYLVPISKGDERAKKGGSNLLKSAISKIVGKHDLEDHELVVTSTTRSSHQLESDAKTHHRGQDSSHQLHQDATIPVRTPGSESPHQLCCDPVAEEAKGPVQHDLEAHQPTQLTKIDRQHNLAKDVTVGAGGCAVAKHDIHAHEIVKSHGTGPPHQLKDDGGVAASGKSWTTHALDSDNTITSSNPGHGSHDLDAHTSTMVVGNNSPLDAFRKH